MNLDEKTKKELELKYNKYLSLLPKKQDRHGFIEHEKCDSLLFTGLVGCLPEVEVDIDAAYDSKNNLWLRRPKENPCFDLATNEGLGSASSISRDMLLGLCWYAYYNNRLDITESIIKQAFNNWFIMGQAKNRKTLFSRCLMNPSLLATYARVSYALGGPNRWWLRWIPVIGDKHAEGYLSHLYVLHLALRGKLKGQGLDKDEEVYAVQARRQPENPLFNYLRGNPKLAAQQLLNERFWPSDRLPSNRNRREPWLIQRDFGDHWKPVTNGPLEIHSGGDFLFVAGLILNKI